MFARLARWGTRGILGRKDNNFLIPGLEFRGGALLILGSVNNPVFR